MVNYAPVLAMLVGGAANALGGYLNNILVDVLDSFDCYDGDGDYGPYCSIGPDDPYGGGTLYDFLAAGGYNIVNEAVAAAGIYTLNSACPATRDLSHYGLSALSLFEVAPSLRLLARASSSGEICCQKRCHLCANRQHTSPNQVASSACKRLNPRGGPSESTSHNP